MDSFCIIPARAGSKRIKNKNLYSINGKPLIAYSIEAAIESNVFNSVLVSTDSEEIAEVSEKYGASVSHLRSPELSNDFIGTHPVIQDSIKNLHISDLGKTVVMCLYATAILITPSQIRLGYEKFLMESQRHPLITLCRYTHPIERAFKKVGDIYQPISPLMLQKRTQDLETKWFDAGQFYLALARDWLLHDEFTGPFNALVMPTRDFIDIDTLEDLEDATMRLQILSQRPRHE